MFGALLEDCPVLTRGEPVTGSMGLFLETCDGDAMVAAAPCPTTVSDADSFSAWLGGDDADFISAWFGGGFFKTKRSVESAS